MLRSLFADRTDAGRRLGERLAEDVTGDAVVLGIPRGGVVVAAEVGRVLGAPIDVVVPRKVGAPFNPELGLGAVAPGVRYLDERLIRDLGVPSSYVEREIEDQQREIERREALYRGGRPPVDVAGKTAIVVDDGVATGVTDTAALRSIRRRRPRRLVLAVPVCPPDSAGRLRDEADEVLCLLTPSLLYGVGQWYRDFSQVSDREVISALGGHSDAAA